MLFVTILSIINSFKVFREIHLLVGDHPYEGLYMMQHFMNNTFARYDYQKMASAAVLMALATGFFVPVLVDYLRTGLVLRFPTLIVCGFTAIASLLSFFTGLQLQGAVKKNKQDFEMHRIAAHNRFSDLVKEKRRG